MCYEAIAPPRIDSIGTGAPDRLLHIGSIEAKRGVLTSLLWEEGVRSSYFLPVKMSMATKWHFA